MAVFIHATHIGDAWLQAYAALEKTGHAINLSVAITDPLHEDLGVKWAIENRLVALRDRRRSGDFANVQSMHTVANTIFPLGLYRPGSPGAAQRFMDNVARSEVQRAHSRRRGWGTYIGRLTAYPARDGQATNQLATILATLGRNRKHVDAYEMPIDAPDARPSEVRADTAGALLHADARTDSRKRGGPCLAHISLTNLGGELAMVALYRAHVYETRAYGNFLGLARLLAFLAAESERRVGQLLVVTGHAYAAVPSRSALLESARKAAGKVTAIETSARPLGTSMRDLDLPGPTS